MMPIRFVCKTCDEPLAVPPGNPRNKSEFEFTTLYSGSGASAFDVIQHNGGSCPKCGRKLEFNPDLVKVSGVKP